LIVQVPKGLGKPEDLRVIGHRFFEVRHADGHVVEADDPLILALGDDRRHGQSDHDSADEQRNPAHGCSSPVSARSVDFEAGTPWEF
jgi:hypothetical protein